MRQPFSLAAFLLCAASVCPLLAASNVAGHLHDSDGAPLPALVVELDGAGDRRVAVADANGRFEFADLAPGKYRLRLTSPGFRLAGDGVVEVGDAPGSLDLRVEPEAISEHIVVTATRSEVPSTSTGVTTTVIDGRTIEAHHPPTVLELLQQSPGAATARTGGYGSQASAFVRGGESRFARILLDGVPLNEPGGAYDFGGLLALDLERIEIVRGATSSLYSTDALAGVLQVLTRRPTSADPRLRLQAEAGSNSWLELRAGVGASSPRLAWNLALLDLETDNEVPNNAFDTSSWVASADTALGDSTSLRLSTTGFSSDIGTPGQAAFGRPDLDASFERQDLQAAARLEHVGGALTHQASVSWNRSDQLSLDPLDSGPYVPTYGGLTGTFTVFDFADPAGFQNLTERLLASYQLSWQAGRRHLVDAGLDIEDESGELGSRSGDLLRPERTNAGIFIQDRFLAGKTVQVTAGARLEDNDSFGTEVVPRLAVAWQLSEGRNAATLHSSAALGIKEPNFFESFGESFFAMGNPDLEPERSRTFDLGVTKRVLDGRLRFDATLFDHRYKDQIAFTTIDFATFQGSYINLGETRAQGLELEVRALAGKHVTLQGAYTLLDGEIRRSASDFDPVFAEGEELLRRPRNRGSLSVDGRLGRIAAGASLVYVGERSDSDFLGLGLRRNPSYTRVDLRLEARLVAGLSAWAVADNALDEEYMEALGFPALGRAFRVGLRWRGWGG